MNGEGVLRRPFVLLVEEVDELFNAHGVGIRQVPILHEPAGNRVGGRVDIHGESGEVVILRVDEGIDAVVLEEGQVVGVVVYRRRAADGVETLLPHYYCTGSSHFRGFHHGFRGSSCWPGTIRWSGRGWI